MKEIKIRASLDTKDAEQNADSLTKSIEALTEQEAELQDQQKKLGEQSKKSIDGATKSTGKLAKGFKGVGLALKAAGIGIIISLLVGLKEVLSQNQVIADKVASVFETVSIVFNEVSNALVDSFTNVSKTTNGFDALGKVILSLITLSFTPLKLTLKALEIGFIAAQLAWENSFLGEGDEGTIKKLTEDLVLAKDELVQIGVSAYDAGVSIVDNFGEAVTEVTEFTTSAIENIKEISIEAAFQTAKANVELRNNARLAAAQQQRLVEQYDRQAEKLRQVRDLESNSIEVRKAANESLLVVLNKQEESMIRLANLQIAAAQADLDKNKTIETQVALTEALANKEGILAQIEGFRSEQQANINGLLREEIELSQTIIDGDEERVRKSRDFAAERETDEALKLELLRTNLMIENEIILEDLERKKELYAEGTQARVDAEEDYKNKKQDIDQQLLQIQDKADKAEVDNTKKVQDLKSSLISQGFKIAIELASKNVKVQKGIAATQATFDTYAAIVAQLKTAAGGPGGVIPGYAIAQAAATGVFGLLQVKKILSTSESSPSASSVSSGGGGAIPTNSQDQQIVPNIEAINQGVGGSQNSQFRNERLFIVQEDIEDKAALNQRLNDLQAA